MKPKIFVGTMRSGEEEFEESRKLILQQKDVDVVHFIVDSLPEYEAHNALWETWNDCKWNFEVFIKVDADTLIDDHTKFSQIAAEFAKNPRLTGMQIPLHDYFMDGPILGLNCFTPQVVFIHAKSRLHADHADTNHDIVYRGEAVTHLTPAGRHCAYPNDRQAFHYGLHRMKKNQRDTIVSVYHAWKKSGGNGRLLALHGARTAAISSVDHDYNSSTFDGAFAQLMSDGIFENGKLSDMEAFMRMLGA